MNKILGAFKAIGLKLYGIIDKFIVVPISTIIYKIQNKLGKDSKLEKILNRPHVLLYLSLLFAVLLFYVVDSKASVLVNTNAEILTNQPVRIIYNSNSLVVEGVPETVDITLIGKKSELYLARQLGENEVVVDLSDYQASDTPVKVKLTYTKPISSLDYKIDPTYVTVTIKEKVSEFKTISYDLLNQDSLDVKLFVKNVTLSKTEVVVKGSQDTLDKIATIKALIDLDNSTFSKEGQHKVDNLKFVAYGSDGQIIDNVEIVDTKITATVELDSYSKDVPIKIETIGELSKDFAISSITINGVDSDSYKTTIYGDEALLEGISSVPVTIDVNGLGAKGSKTSIVSISKPAGVRHISEQTITVVLNFGDAKQADVRIEGISSKNVPSGLKVNLGPDETKYVDVNVKGVQSAVDAVVADPSSVSAYIDLSTYNTVGEHDVEVKVDCKDSRLQCTAKKTVKIIISKDE